jgi:hypothetical protein
MDASSPDPRGEAYAVSRTRGPAAVGFPAARSRDGNLTIGGLFFARSLGGSRMNTASAAIGLSFGVVAGLILSL